MAVALKEISYKASKAPKTLPFCNLDLVLELTEVIFLIFPMRCQIPRLKGGFWEFSKDSEVIPIDVQNSHELGKFPTSTNTGSQSNENQLCHKTDMIYH